MKYLKKYKDILFIGIILITYVFFLINLDYVGSTFSKIIGLLTPFIYGFALAYILNPLLNFIEHSKLLKNIKKEKNKRNIGIFLSYTVFISFLCLFLLFIIPALWDSINQLIKEIPNIGTNIENFINEKIPKTINLFNSEIKIGETLTHNVKQIFDTFISNSGSMASKAVDFTKTLTTTILNIILGVIISLYMLIQKDTFVRQSKKILYALLPEERANDIKEIVSQLHVKISKFLTAKIIDSAIIGIMCYIGVMFIGIKSSLLVAIIVGVTNIIPYFGPFIGAIPCVIIILADDFTKALIFGIFILALQQFDGNILGPKLLGDSLGLSAFWIIFAVVIMTGILGFAGMLIGVPIFAVIYTLIQEFIDRRIKEKNIKTEDEE